MSMDQKDHSSSSRNAGALIDSSKPNTSHASPSSISSTSSVRTLKRSRSPSTHRTPTASNSSDEDDEPPLSKRKRVGTLYTDNNDNPPRSHNSHSNGTPTMMSPPASVDHVSNANNTDDIPQQETGEVEVQSGTRTLANQNTGVTGSDSNASTSGDTEALSSGRLPSPLVAPAVLAENAQESTADLLGHKFPEVRIAKYKRVLHEEQTGLVKFQLAHNDGAKGNLILLSKLKQVIQAQLPKMPREYISRIVYSREHYSYVIVRDTGEVIAGITFRPFVERKFAEIVFLAVLSDFQTGGYGARLIAHFKDYVRQQFGIEHLLTYADNFAIGFFKKQGFTSEITLDKAIWVGYIKDYEGATLLQCTFLPKVQYLQIYSYYAEHRKAVLQRIREGLRSHVVHPGIEAFREEGAAVDPSTIPGLLEAGWTPEMEEKGYMDGDPKTPLYHMLVQLLTELRESPHSWPFLEPVAGVPDYYEIIKQPMDLRTMGERLADDKYQTAEDFEADFSLIVKNCKIYNDDGTQYVRCANRLEKFFRERLKALMLLYE